MKTTIWKYDLQITDVQMVMMPQYSKLLDAQFQDGKLCLWVLVNPDGDACKRRVEIYGTGLPGPGSFHHDYIGTAQDKLLGLVWHVFDGGEV